MEELFYLAKIGEINLKKGNLKDFEMRLSQNLRSYLPEAKPNIRVRAGRMYVSVKPEFKEKTEEALNKLIGITGWAEALPAEKTIEAITETAKAEAIKARDAGAKTFKIESRRGEKTFPLTSYEISREVGGVIHTEGILKVDVHNPDIVISIEVREKAFIYGLEHKGRRGLPCGCSGRGLLLLSGGIDSPVAGFKMLTRGMKLDYIYFHSHPYTSPEAQAKVEKLAEILAAYGLGGYLNIIPFTKVQQQIREKSPEAYLTLMMRICMMKIANMTARGINSKCLITGESLAQVASQTVENLTVTNSYAEFPVFRPLIGLDKEEITIEAKSIGTYETSILPYEDCCVMFSPKHPILHSNLKDAAEIFERMEIDALLEEAYSQREVKKDEFLKMIKNLVDLRIERIHCISSPAEMVEKIPASDSLYSFIAESRKTISDIINGKDERFLLIVGPCSIHDTEAAEDYAMRLLELKKKCADSFYIVMRTYFEKPRTVLGWRGLIVEPELDGFINIEGGIQKARKFLIKLAEIGIPAASETVDPMIPQYIADLVSWASIGARSAESQIHREIASGLSMPVGFKNTTYGDITAAINGVIASRLPHAFVGIARNGLSAIIHTTGNPDTHLVLRGGISKPNYNREEVKKAASLMKEKMLEPSVVIDCSHGNSGKDPKKQISIFEESLKLRFDKNEPLDYIRGCMIESFIQEGSTSIEKAKEGSEYGKSITDPCLGWEETQKEILRIYERYKARKQK